MKKRIRLILISLCAAAVVISAAAVLIFNNFASPSQKQNTPSVFVFNESETAESSQSEQTHTTLHAENGIPGDDRTQVPSTAFTTTPDVSVPAAVSAFTTTVPAPTEHGSDEAYTGNQMCVVTAAYADTWPSGNDDKFVPYYSPLVQGTTDYVIGQSEAYDSDEEEVRTFYELASGRKVQQKDVSLSAASDMGDNELTVVSSTTEGGNLKIVLSTKWKVPYNFTFSPQNYYTARGKHYNVSSFTASSIQFTFYYTTAVSGQVNTAGSDVVSSAAWGVDTAAKTAVLTMPLKAQGAYYGYSLEYDAAGNMVITINNRPQTLAGSVILLDPGHGGNDPGALGYGDMVEEADINFSAAVMVKNELESRGATVYLTRYEDKTMSLEERKAFARAVKPDVFVSIHSNAAENSSAYGTEVYYYRPMSQPLSQAIYSELISTYRSYVYPGDSARLSGIEGGSNFYPFSVARLEECPSVLVEMGYVTNYQECMRLVDNDCRQKIAVAIANGIEKYIAR